jgi:hypothetical protein
MIGVNVAILIISDKLGSVNKHSLLTFLGRRGWEAKAWGRCREGRKSD